MLVHAYMCHIVNHIQMKLMCNGLKIAICITKQLLRKRYFTHNLRDCSFCLQDQNHKTYKEKHWYDLNCQIHLSEFKYSRM